MDKFLPALLLASPLVAAWAARRQRLSKRAEQAAITKAKHEAQRASSSSTGEVRGETCYCCMLAGGVRFLRPHLHRWPQSSDQVVCSDEFLAALPKTDLHVRRLSPLSTHPLGCDRSARSFFPQVHLDGSLRLSTLIELAREANVELPAYTEEGLRRLVFKDEYENLVGYLTCFAYTTAVRLC